MLFSCTVNLRVELLFNYVGDYMNNGLLLFFVILAFTGQPIVVCGQKDKCRYTPPQNPRD